MKKHDTTAAESTPNANPPEAETGKGQLKVEYLAVDDLVPYEGNPRDNDAAVKCVSASIAEFGFINPIIVGRGNVVLAGHTRIKSARELGEKTVPVIRVDLTPEQERAYRLADNKVGELAEWDKAMLAQEAELLKDSGIDLAQFGFDTSELEDLLTDNSDDGGAGAALPDDAHVRTRTGDLWQLGDHRLIVGDSTDAAVVARLMDGATADLWLTDPPYNVDYHGAAGTIENDNMGDAQFLAFLVAAFRTAADALKPGGAGYVFHADSEGLNFRTAVKEAGLKTAQRLIWKKNALVLGRQDYQWIHEPALYVRKPGAAHYFTADRTQTTVIDEPMPNLDTMPAEELRKMLRRILAIRHTTVLEFPKPKKNADHPTEKPVPLFMQLVKNSTRRGEVVLDTFAGSDTTVIACEKCGRVARVAELDPKYATVILDRWEAETGGKAVKLEAV